MPKAEILGDIQGLLTMNETLLSKKKARVIMARTTSSRSDANGKEPGTAASLSVEALEGADGDVEGEVDLKSPGLLEREKDRIAQVLSGDTGDTFTESEAQAARAWGKPLCGPVCSSVRERKRKRGCVGG
ncbi:hypothetical protein EST38_g9158 [Candolleomyces aberdarensis]|uniref:Uncharacterized protein n=1 Tax=Candolleomyces aberdarensis TaxID=2316362 RepID=A0A4Q2DCZ3_9AGAR|nr:hypothetical protein EST38_g9158 [Candolleomyces aberdarensis]